jgi:hypothetical protein
MQDIPAGFFEREEGIGRNAGEVLEESAGVMHIFTAGHCHTLSSTPLYYILMQIYPMMGLAESSVMGIVALQGPNVLHLKSIVNIYIPLAPLPQHLSSQGNGSSPCFRNPDTVLF